MRGGGWGYGGGECVEVPIGVYVKEKVGVLGAHTKGEVCVGRDVGGVECT